LVSTRARRLGTATGQLVSAELQHRSGCSWRSTRHQQGRFGQAITRHKRGRLKSGASKRPCETIEGLCSHPLGTVKRHPPTTEIDSFQLFGANPLDTKV